MRILKTILCVACLYVFVSSVSALRRAIDPDQRVYVDLYVPLIIAALFGMLITYPARSKK